MSNFSKICATCKYCDKLAFSNDYICQYCGVVERGNYCKKYGFDPMKITVRRRRNLDVSRFDPKDFSLED